MFTKPTGVVKRALFLDRDGVINKRAKEHSYIYKPEEFVINPGVVDLISRAQLSRYLVIVVTNQRGVARGIYTHEDVRRLSLFMRDQLFGQGCELDAVYYCPHACESACECRKPRPGMFLEAIRDYNIDVSRSVMVGDCDDDVIAAQAAGVVGTYKIKSDILVGLEHIFKE